MFSSMSAKSKIAAWIGFAMMLLLALPAAAVPPQRSAISLTQDFIFATCSYGPLNASQTQTASDIAFFDTSLNVTRVQVHASVTTLITNPLNGKTATGTNNIDITLIFSDFTVIVRGLIDQIRAPGFGVVAQSGGRLAIDAAGNIVFLTPNADPTEGITTDPSLVCAALQ
jgi:hypothetical protein